MVPSHTTTTRRLLSCSSLNWVVGNNAASFGLTALLTSSTPLSAEDDGGRHPRSLPSTHNVLNIVPAILLGAATAGLYAAVAQHPASHLTRRSAVYLLLLALQVSIQPKVSQSFLRKSDDQVSVALMEEFAKTGMAAVLFLGTTGASARREALAAWSPRSSLQVAAAPAALYAVQGVLTYHALQRVDGVAYNGLMQLKTATAALWCYALLGTPQSPQQIAAIAVLIISALLFQAPAPSSSSSQTKEKQGKTAGGSSLIHHSGGGLSMTGITACVGATLVSGLAGALSQKGVQSAVVRGEQTSVVRDPFFYAGEVSLYSALCLVVASLQKRWTRTVVAPGSAPPPPQLSVSLSSSLLLGRKGLTLSPRASLWIPVAVKAAGGIVTVLVHKHAGSVPKGFALVLGLVLSGLYEPQQLSPHRLLGTVLVLLSSWMHFTSPPLP